MYFFIKNPEKYATGSEKAKSKVEAAKNTFEKIKGVLDDKTINDFCTAVEKHEKRLR